MKYISLVCFFPQDTRAYMNDKSDAKCVFLENILNFTCLKFVFCTGNWFWLSSLLDGGVLDLEERADGCLPLLLLELWRLETESESLQLPESGPVSALCNLQSVAMTKTIHGRNTRTLWIIDNNSTKNQPRLHFRYYHFRNRNPSLSHCHRHSDHHSIQMNHSRRSTLRQESELMHWSVWAVPSLTIQLESLKNHKHFTKLRPKFEIIMRQFMKLH